MKADRAALDRALLQAHAAKDGGALARLYAQAGDAAQAEGRVDAACFFWSHARVFALEAGDPRAERLRAALAAHGRER